MFYTVSTLVLLIIVAGLRYRREPRLHIPLMLAAFAIDLALVLIIEFQRKAVEHVATEVVHGTDYFLIFHAGVSLLVLVFYGMLTYTGNKIYAALKMGAAKPVNIYVLHKKLAKGFIVLRLINYVTSFWM